MIDALEKLHQHFRTLWIFAMSLVMVGALMSFASALDTPSSILLAVGAATYALAGLTSAATGHAPRLSTAIALISLLLAFAVLVPNRPGYALVVPAVILVLLALAGWGRME